MTRASMNEAARQTHASSYRELGHIRQKRRANIVKAAMNNTRV